MENTNTQSVANTMCTAASVSSDLNGMAVLDACNQLVERFQPIIQRMPGKNNHRKIDWLIDIDIDIDIDKDIDI